MAYGQVDTFIGLPSIGTLSATTVSTTQDTVLGVEARAVDPYWGGAEFIYLKAGGTIAFGNLAQWDNTYTATALANTANAARATAICMAAMTINQYGWFMRTGQGVVTATASVAAGTPFGITGAGTVGASSAGKEIEGAVSGGASTVTVVKTGFINSGSPTMVVPNFDGWFVGITLTGTGISGTVTALNLTDRTVTMSANATATGSVSATGTYTGFIIANMDRAFVQGRIT